MPHQETNDLAADHAMSSFTATRDIPSPSPSDVNEYRRYLATHQPVTEIEARFLDSTDDLVTLAPPPPRPSPTPSRAPSPLSSGAMAAAAAAARDHHYYQALKSTLDAAESAPAPAPASAKEIPATGPIPDPEPSSPIPIPGTMHGNSWRTNRGHLRGSSSVSHSPSPGLGGLAALGSAPLRSPRGSSTTRPRSSSEALTPRFFTPRSGTPPVGKAEPTAPAAAATAAAAVPTIKVDQPSSINTAASLSAEEAGAGSPVVLHVAIAVAVAVLLPILTFSTIPGLVGRLIVVVLVGMSVAGSVVQSGAVGARAAGGYSRDLFVSVAVYAGVMAVVAGVL